MLKELTLNNFRCFKDHRLTFDEFTVAVGVNNAGKSSMVEALRIISLYTSRYRSLQYVPAPWWANMPRFHSEGTFVDLAPLELNFDTLCYCYAEPPAIIKATFDDESEITVMLGKNRANHALIRGAGGRRIASRQDARSVHIPLVRVLPQIGPLAQKEQLLSRAYIERSAESRLTSLHFRNQLMQASENEFQAFVELSERTWPGLQIRSRTQTGSGDDWTLGLEVRDKEFVGEISVMGHGLQMWLQTMWFLTKSPANAIVVLDEPDVYMHAVMQRKLVRWLRGRFNQTVIASHSLEIMSEVGRRHILVVNRNSAESTAITSVPELQETVEMLGSVTNIHLFRLWDARSFLLVEGEDLAFLKRLQNIAFPTSEVPLDTIPGKSMGGSGAWEYERQLYPRDITNVSGRSVRKYCILDRDYISDDLRDSRMDEAKSYGFELHIWSKTEIENYLIVPSAIRRVIEGRARAGVNPPSIEEIERQLGAIASDLKEGAITQIANGYFLQKKSLGLVGATNLAREFVNDRWSTVSDMTSIVPGKEVISAISAWTSREYGVSFGAMTLAEELLTTEIHPEVKRVIDSVQSSNPFRLKATGAR